MTVILLCSACSMTKGIPEDDQLFVGLKKTTYTDDSVYQEGPYEEHLATTKEEIEAALATEPNGSLFGSSYYTVPWSWHLWVYNRFANKDSKFAKWMAKSFGHPPVLMSQVNPALHASVARSVLHNNGFFRGDVTYEVIPKKNPKKSKIAYTVQLDTLFTLDSVSYVNFPADMQALIDSTSNDSYIKRDLPFSITALDGERNRISNLMRNNGYYYYKAGNASYLADTFAVSNKSQLRFQLADGLPEEALHKWYIGKIDVQFRKTMREQLTDSIQRRQLTIHYNGKQSPIRPSIVLKDMRLLPRQEFSYENYQESVNRLNSNGLFSSIDFQFKPRPDTDTLDVALNCVFDKPYDFYIEGNVIGRTSGRYGPQAKIGFTKRNAFRAGEKLDINLHGSYEFSYNGGSNMNSYQYGAEASLEFPRLLIPFYNPQRRRLADGAANRVRRRRLYSTPVTYAKVGTDIIHRPEYYKMHTVSGEWTYRWQPAETRRYEFSPLTVKYQFKNTTTEKLDSVVKKNKYLERTMEDYFIPKMRYTYLYTSPAKYRNPIRWETTIEESGNLISLYDVLRGKSFNEKNKPLFKNPYAQFVKVETDFTKTWSLGSEASLVGHLNAGYIHSYGNSYKSEVPYIEEFYVGGANSVRAFPMRGIGPGRFDTDENDKQSNYLYRNGSLKFVANLEYRAPLFGSLQGALFLDAGNIWRVDYTSNFTKEIIFGNLDGMDEYYLAAIDEAYEEIKNMLNDMDFKGSEFLNDLALCAGIGLRYNLGFLVIRLDWGFALHTPYNTGKSGYFNISRFSDAQTLHFAIGYPF